MMSSQGVVFAAAAAAVSCTVLLLALRLQKSLQFPLHHNPSTPILRSCISSSTSDGKKKKKKKKKKRVHFAEGVVESSRRKTEERKGEEVRRNYREPSSETEVRRSCSNGGIEENRGMPANRVALYNGILRDRVAQRLAYSY